MQTSHQLTWSVYHRHGTPLAREGIQIPRTVFKMNVYYGTVASTATVFGTLYIREIHVCFYLVIEHWLIRHVGFSKGKRFGLLLLESSISQLFLYVDALFISIYNISLDPSDYKVGSTLLMFTDSYMWCIFALIHDFCTRNVTAITSEPFSWLENGWRRSSGLLSPWYQDPTFSPFSHDLWSFFLPLWWLRVLRDS